MSYKPGTKVQLGPMVGLGTDPYWLTITAVAKDGEITTADEDGMVDHVPAAIWAEEYAPRVLDTVEPDSNPDEPPMEEEDEQEEILFGGPELDESGAIEPDGVDDEPAPALESCPGEEEYTPPKNPNCQGYAARNMKQNAESLARAGVDPRNIQQQTPLERLADMVNRQYNCRSMARKFQQEADVLAGQIEDFLLKIARKAIVDQPAPDPLTAALGEALEERAPQEPPAVEEIPTEQAQAIAESVAAQVKEEAASDDYEAVSRLEMNRSLREVRGISDAQAARMAEKGIKTLANFCQAVEERPADWWSGMLYINKAKGDVIEDAVEAHWQRFRKQHHRV